MPLVIFIYEKAIISLYTSACSMSVCMKFSGEYERDKRERGSLNIPACPSFCVETLHDVQTRVYSTQSNTDNSKW